jgi:hypothetical protein
MVLSMRHNRRHAAGLMRSMLSMLKISGLAQPPQPLMIITKRGRMIRHTAGTTRFPGRR